MSGTNVVPTKIIRFYLTMLECSLVSENILFSSVLAPELRLK